MIELDFLGGRQRLAPHEVLSLVHYSSERGADVKVIGLDIGGTAVKAGLVDTASGELIGARRRVPTPPDGGPDDMAVVLATLAAELSSDAPIGIGFPGPIVHGRIMTATHLAESWIGCDAPEFFGQVLGRRCNVLNDADAAGLAEMRFGAGVGETGVVLMLTLGTGIGSALFVDGVLVPNLEFGHIEIDGAVAEDRAAARQREIEHLSWEEWGGRLRHLPAADRRAGLAGRHRARRRDHRRGEPASCRCSRFGRES